MKFHGYEMYQFAPNLKIKLQHLLLRPFVKWNIKHADHVYSYGGKITTIIENLGISKENIKEIPSGIESSWINQNFTFDYNMPHNHTGSLIQFSGIWYIKAPKNCGDVLFLNKSENSDPTNLFKYIDDPLSWVNYRITPEDNKLILFPSTLVHLVEPSRSSQDRISVAFNVSLI